MSEHTRDTKSESVAADTAPDCRPSPSVAPAEGARRRVVVDAPAKINLRLEILGRREDGYHDIDTIMQTVDLVDTLELVARDDDGFSLTVAERSKGVPADETNLVIKAAKALARELRSRAGNADLPGADIELVKRIPSGAGLGGGSSDAAATLVGLRELWNADVSDDLLEDVAASVGSDVPFFVRGGTVRCTGRGEILEPLAATGTMHAVLVFGEPLGTALVYDVFSAMDLTLTHTTDMLFVCEGRTVRLEEFGMTMLRNDLEGAACQVRPDLMEVKRSLVRAGARQTCISGSGSCFFGVAESEVHAEQIASKMVDAGHECVVVKSVGPRRRGGG